MNGKRKHGTEIPQINEHLSIKVKNPFQASERNTLYRAPSPVRSISMITNFGIKVHNAYVFVLLHLRNKSQKNPINVTIPDVCIFNQRVPYDIVYSSKGYIRGLKAHQASKVKLKDAYKFFKDVWSDQALTKNDYCMIIRGEDEVKMVSDTSFYLICCFTKADDIFKHLHYIQNKIPSSDHPLIRTKYPSTDDNKYLKLGIESLMGNLDEQQLQEGLTEHEYLCFLNKKIVLYLNYQHNIRIESAEFIYTKLASNKYSFTDVRELEFENLTAAIKRRQIRLDEQEIQKSKILEFTPEKEKKYKIFEDKPEVKELQKTMNEQFRTLVRKMDFLSIKDSKKEEVKNELAFKKLHPSSRITYTEVIGGKNFTAAKRKLFQQFGRKQISVPSRNVMKFYNRIRVRNRIKTQSILHK